jgi:hypothetical protein
MANPAALFNELIKFYELIVIEAVVVIAVVLIALIAPRLGFAWFRMIERKFVRFARRRALSVVIVGLLALAGRAALLAVVPIPQPGTHDEFSYLLAADTFASGRLTNPTHPMWKHFESFHILQRPTYMSMYPIAQSLLMAAGKVLLGHSWWGVWLTAGVLCAALCWMLQAWLPPQWALLGGLLAVMRIALFSYWMNSYMGGAAAALGGVLVFGALPRIMRRRRVRDALLMGIGIIFLANSRPNEGFFLIAGVFLVLGIWAIKRRPPIRELLARIALPLGSILALMCLAMGFYFWRGTGNPLRMPYQVNRATYATAPLFFFQTPGKEPHYNHVVMRDFYRWEEEVYDRSRSPKGALIRSAGKLVTVWLFYFGPALSIPLIMLPLVLRDKRLRLLLIVGAVAIIGLIIPPWFNAHYAAPLTGLIYAVLLQGMRHLRACRWRGRETGLLLARALPLICIAMLPLRIAAAPLHIKTETDWRATWCCGQPGLMERAELLKQLEAMPGRQLVIVRYKPDHDYHTEWVYNEANVDAAKVVWAREMDAENDRELISYFKDRKLWLLEADEKPPRLSPYPVAQPTAPVNSSQLK